MDGPVIVVVNFDSPQKLHRFTCPYSLRDAVSPKWHSFGSETKARHCVEGEVSWCGVCGKDVNEAIYNVRPETRDLFAKLVNECLGNWAEELWASVKDQIERMEPGLDQRRFHQIYESLCREKRSLQDVLDACAYAV